VELWRLLAHNHWFTLSLYGYRLRLCARCSGYLLGFTVPMLFSGSIAVPLGFLGSGVQQLVCVILALPYALDWVTQSWGFRQSSNPVRLATGILLGVDIFIFSRLGLQAGRIIFVGAALFVALIGHLGART
jgi:uncharacterized membrane protein